MEEDPGVLDEQAFRHFAPLLHACQDYATLSGCRFHSNSFVGISSDHEEDQSDTGGLPTVSAARGGDSGPRLNAKLRSMPVVRQFTDRLHAQEPGLLEEIDRAYRIVMTESIRNAMRGMFQALGIFPPSPPPCGIEDDDCSYEDVAADLPVIAQRLYNDQVRRLSDTTGGPCKLERRAMTAAFLIDFATSTGMQLPPMSETQTGMLRDFADRTAEYSKTQDGSQSPSGAHNAFLAGLGAGSVADGLRAEAKSWFSKNWQSMVLTAAAGAVVGTVAMVGAMLSHRKQRQQERRQERSPSSRR